LNGEKISMTTGTEIHNEICNKFRDKNYSKVFIAEYTAEGCSKINKIILEDIISNNNILIGYCDVVIDYEDGDGRKHKALVEVKSSADVINKDPQNVLRQIKKYRFYNKSITQPFLVYTSEGSYNLVEDTDLFSDEGITVVDIEDFDFEKMAKKRQKIEDEKLKKKEAERLKAIAKEKERIIEAKKEKEGIIEAEKEKEKKRKDLVKKGIGIKSDLELMLKAQKRKIKSEKFILEEEKIKKKNKKKETEIRIKNREQMLLDKWERRRKREAELSTQEREALSLKKSRQKELVEESIKKEEMFLGKIQAKKKEEERQQKLLKKSIQNASSPEYRNKWFGDG
jgi:hypothetical protein